MQTTHRAQHPHLLRSRAATVTRALADYEKLKAIANDELSKIPECAGYEVGMAQFAPGAAETIADVAVETLRSLYAR